MRSAVGAEALSKVIPRGKENRAAVPKASTNPAPEALGGPTSVENVEVDAESTRTL